MLIPLKNDKSIDVNANGYSGISTSNSSGRSISNSATSIDTSSTGTSSNSTSNNTIVRIRICAIGYLIS